MKIRSGEALALTIDRKTGRTDDGCLTWTGAISKSGVISINLTSEPGGPKTTVPRLTWAMKNGKIPEGHIVARRPTCTNKRCVEPAHFELMESDRGNAAATAAKLRVSTTPTVEEAIANINTRKTHCKRGHEFTPENTLIQIRKAGTDLYGRACRACRKQRQQDRKTQQTGLAA
jgi:hypothetical protein